MIIDNILTKSNWSTTKILDLLAKYFFKILFIILGIKRDTNGKIFENTAVNTYTLGQNIIYEYDIYIYKNSNMKEFKAKTYFITKAKLRNYNNAVSTGT